MKKTIKFIFLTLFIWLALSTISTVNAATVTIKANKTSVTVGESVTVTVNVNAAAWNLKVSGSASDTIVGYNADAENQKTTKTYKIDTSKAGTYKVALSGDITDESKDTADTINTSISVTVKAKETTTNKDTTTTDKNTTNKDTTTDKNTTNKDNVNNNTNTNKEEIAKPKEKSSNAFLTTLGVRIKDKLAEELGVKADEYDFAGFSKTKTSYEVTIPKNVDYLNVVYGKADSNATVKVTGNSGFEVGSNNKITIKVTAEDGKTTKTYTIKVTKLAEEEEKPGNLIEDTKDIYLTKLNIDGVELSPEFSKDIYSYTAELTDESITELKVTAKANNKDVNIDISGNTELVEGENTINIVLTVENAAEQIVYQVLVTKPVAESITQTPVEIQSSTGDIIGMFKGYIGIALGVVLLMIVAVVVLIILLRKENRRIKEENDNTEETKTEEYNVYDNDENEFENEETKRDNFIESLYQQRNGNAYNEEKLSDEEKETVEGQSVEYTPNDLYEENPLEIRRKRRGKGKHSL